MKLIDNIVYLQQEGNLIDANAIINRIIKRDLIAQIETLISKVHIEGVTDGLTITVSGEIRQISNFSKINDSDEV